MALHQTVAGGDVATDQAGPSGFHAICLNRKWKSINGRNPTIHKRNVLKHWYITGES